jgi:hypothetical protein
MRTPLSQIRRKPSGRLSAAAHKPTLVLLALQILPACAGLQGCGGGAGSGPPPPPPPPAISVTVTPATGAVLLGNSQTLVATVSNTTDTNVSWSVNSVGGGTTSAGTITTSGTYTAPADLPSPSVVQVTATSQDDTTKSATAQLTITSDLAITLSPANANVELGSTQGFHPTITSAGHPDTSVRWSLSGATCPAACGSVDLSGNYTAPGVLPAPATATMTAQSVADPSKQASAPINITSNFTLQVTAPQSVPAGGSATIVATMTPLPGSNPSTVLACQSVTNGATLQVDYLAPGAIPQPNPVSVLVTSAADITKTASAQITVINHVLVSVQPQSITLAPLAVQGFTAAVLGTNNQSVIWQIQGTACANAGVCGSIDAIGNYTAPGSAPSPDALQVVAISSDDTTQSGAANVAISTGANILSLHPASVYAGAANGFTILVEGTGFAASSPGPGSTLLIGGAAPTTTCIAATECSAPVTAADVSISGTVSLQIENPGGKRSNAVSLVVAIPNASDDVIALSSASPAASGKDIIVVDPTTAGVSAQGNDVDINVAALGVFSVANNSCSLSGNPVALQRPASGNSTFDLCVFSESGLDASMTYAVSGPGDVIVIAKQPAGLGIIHITLQIPASALPGARTLFIQNTNLDKTASSGALVIQ